MTIPFERPRQLRSVTYGQEVGHHKVYVNVGYDDNYIPREVFLTVGHDDQCERAYIEALGRSISLGLRYGIPAEEFIDQLLNISCIKSVTDSSKSPADFVARSLKEFLDEDHKNLPDHREETINDR